MLATMPSSFVRSLRRALTPINGLTLAVTLASSACERAQKPSGHRSEPAVSMSTSASSSAPLTRPLPSETATPCLTPQSLSLIRLLELQPTEAGERAALTAVRRELTRLLTPPSEYYATLQTAGDIVVAELWHESSFAPENCGKAGNPGERNRTISYDVRKARIVGTKVWQ